MSETIEQVITIDFSKLKCGQPVTNQCIDCKRIVTSKFRPVAITRYKNYRCQRCSYLAIKKCNVCLVKKPRSEFLCFDDGTNPICNNCWIHVSGQYANSISAKQITSLLSVRKYSATHRKEIAYRAKFNKDKSPRDFLMHKIGRMRSDKRHEVSIDTNYLLALYTKNNGRCAITGVKMIHKAGFPNSISIDRINSSKEYIPGNVQLVCQFINLGKRDFDNDQIHDFVNEIVFAKTTSLMVGAF